jgi:transposase InsO family protein
VPWQEKTTMELRYEFVVLAEQAQAERKMSALCQQYGISRKAGYALLKRYKAEGLEGLTERSRRPKTSPTQTAEMITEHIVILRKQHPTWGARKLKARLEALGHTDLPSVTTVNHILKRQGCIEKVESLKHKAWKRFEHEAPNDLWQMDFKGHFSLLTQERCHPLTVLDDHSRFNLTLTACRNEQGSTVQAELIKTFRRYGLPKRFTVDNGPPWGTRNDEDTYTQLTVWLLQLGIKVGHSRPYHPQTQGKDERFHRTLKAEVLQNPPFPSFEQCQKAFDTWRNIYNCQRPHQALGLQPPVKRYAVSPRPYPEKLECFEYGPDDQIRKVFKDGYFRFKGGTFKVSQAFYGQNIALRPSSQDGQWDVYFCHQKVSQLSLTEV